MRMAMPGSRAASPTPACWIPQPTPLAWLLGPALPPWSQPTTCPVATLPLAVATRKRGPKRNDVLAEPSVASVHRDAPDRRLLTDTRGTKSANPGLLVSMEPVIDYCPAASGGSVHPRQGV